GPRLGECRSDPRLIADDRQDGRHAATREVSDNSILAYRDECIGILVDRAEVATHVPRIEDLLHDIRVRAESDGIRAGGAPPGHVDLSRHELAGRVLLERNAQCVESLAQIGVFDGAAEPGMRYLPAT